MREGGLYVAREREVRARESARVAEHRGMSEHHWTGSREGGGARETRWLKRNGDGQREDDLGKSEFRKQEEADGPTGRPVGGRPGGGLVGEGV